MHKVQALNVSACVKFNSDTITIIPHQMFDIYLKYDNLNLLYYVHWIDKRKYYFFHLYLKDTMIVTRDWLKK